MEDQIALIGIAELNQQIKDTQDQIKSYKATFNHFAKSLQTTIIDKKELKDDILYKYNFALAGLNSHRADLHELEIERMKKISSYFLDIPE